jgi:hypothetical protein
MSASVIEGWHGDGGGGGGGGGGGDCGGGGGDEVMSPFALDDAVDFGDAGIVADSQPGSRTANAPTRPSAIAWRRDIARSSGERVIDVCSNFARSS